MAAGARPQAQAAAGPRRRRPRRRGARKPAQRARPLWARWAAQMADLVRAPGGEPGPQAPTPPTPRDAASRQGPIGGAAGSARRRPAAANTGHNTATRRGLRLRTWGKRWYQACASFRGSPGARKAGAPGRGWGRKRGGAGGRPPTDWRAPDGTEAGGWRYAPFYAAARRPSRQARPAR